MKNCPKCKAELTACPTCSAATLCRACKACHGYKPPMVLKKVLK